VPVRAESLVGRFKSLIVEIASLIDRFISLFAPVGNFHSAISEYQWLTGI
jgi:hypothetical protein